MIKADTPRPFIEHIQEIRKRLLIILAALTISIALSYAFSEEIFAFLLLPFEKTIQNQPHRMIYLGLTEAFTTYLKVAFWGGVTLSFPVITYQLWRFIYPGLKAEEKKVLRPFFVIAPFLFVIGSLFAYLCVIPLAWSFFLTFENPSLPLPLLFEARMSEYFSLVLSFLLAFGLSFQFPLVLIGLFHLGFLSSKHLILNRKYAIILIFIVAAILTPPDVLSQILLAIPLMLLYEGTIWMIKRHERLKPDTFLKTGEK